MTEKELYNQLEEYDKTVIKLSKELSTLNKLNQQNFEKRKLLQQRIDKTINYVNQKLNVDNPVLVEFEIETIIDLLEGE